MGRRAASEGRPGDRLAGVGGAAGGADAAGERTGAASLALPVEYAITNAAQFGTAQMLARLEQRLEQGLRLLQVREPDWRARNGACSRSGRSVWPIATGAKC